MSSAFQHQVQVRPGASAGGLRASYQDPQNQKKRHSNKKNNAQMRHSLMHVQTANGGVSRGSSASSTSASASSPPERGYNIHTTSRDASPQHQLHPEHPGAADAAGDEILKVEIPRWKSKLNTDRANRLHVPESGADSAGNSPVASGAARSSTWNGKEGRGGHGGSMGALVLGRDRDGASNKKRYTVFQVYVHYKSGAIRVSEKRYSHFRELHKTLRRKYATDMCV
ncbi:hypothetical protein PHYBOEH_005694 [Phytophthora boehmeriae]|uniref:PX domain-containing protein n=1 Tax=Phytophthora boehmeriae TaxID=109152 RepID=A0A8T1X8W8_9STRA|nr:hypothetical protein PHYBOEH_005694 [Phytophthora boehmeriae]